MHICYYICICTKQENMFNFFKGIYFYLISLGFPKQFSLCSSGCSGSFSIDQAGIEFRDTPASFCFLTTGIKDMFTITTWLIKSFIEISLILFSFIFIYLLSLHNILRGQAGYQLYLYIILYIKVLNAHHQITV